MILLQTFLLALAVAVAYVAAAPSYLLHPPGLVHYANGAVAPVDEPNVQVENILQAIQCLLLVCC